MQGNGLRTFPHTASLPRVSLFSHTLTLSLSLCPTLPTPPPPHWDNLTWQTSLHSSKRACTQTHMPSFSNKHWLLHWYRCTASALRFLWHELNMSWFQAPLPVVVCVVTAGKYSQRSQSNAYVFPLSGSTLTKGFYQLLSQHCTPVTLGEENIDPSHASKHKNEKHLQMQLQTDTWTHLHVSFQSASVLF